MVTDQFLIETALSCGAAKAAVIAGEQIDLNDEYRRICESNGCGGYGRCWMCPPHTGTIEENMAAVRSFPKGLLFQTIGQLEDSFDIEGMQEAKRIHLQVCQRLLDATKPVLTGRTLYLGAGGCGLCETCAIIQNEPCRFPDRAMPPMEGYGIGVANTASSTELKYINGQNTVTYFGLVLFDEA